MENLELSLIIIGKICSGKSTLANDFKKWLKIPSASFGGYLAYYSKQNNLSVERESLQDLGNQFIKNDSSEFLKKVMNFSDPNAARFIFEGVRHKVIFDEVKAISKVSFSIFLDANEDVRRERFINREKDIDRKNHAPIDFEKLSQHPVEQEVDELKAHCNFVISTNESYQDFLKALSLYK